MDSPGNISLCSSSAEMTPPSCRISIPLTIVFGGQMGESENSGSALVTPKQHRRRRPTHHALPAHLQRKSRKVSIPPELQAHLGVQPVPTINLTSPSNYRGSVIPDAADTTEFIININKQALPEGLNSGSDSGVPSEYSSWAAPVAGRFDNSSPYEDITPGSISGSLEDIPSAGRQGYISDSDEEMGSPETNHRNAGGVVNPGFVNTESQQQSLVLAVNGPPPPLPNHPPPPLLRSKTDTNLLSSISTPTTPNINSLTKQCARPRTNSMVFQLNLSGGFQGFSNSLPRARSVSMISLNTAGNAAPNVPVTYPNLSGFSNDTQSIYSDTGGPPNYAASGFYGLSNNFGSQGNLSGIGYNHPTLTNQLHSYESEHDDAHPTQQDVKDRWFVDTLCSNLSTMYAILLFMIGCVLYLADTFSKKDTFMGEAFNVYLIIVQLLWLGYIHIDVRKYVNTVANALEEAKEKGENGDPVQLETTPDGQYQLRINLPEPRKSFPQHYGFTTGRHGGSLYLKIGAAVFCLGYLIHTGLNLGQKILYIVEENSTFASCTCAQDILMSVLQPIYAFYQLFFIFKYSNLIINRRKRLSKFALMHCISSSLLFWVYTIIQETLQAISEKKEAYERYRNTTMTPVPYMSSTTSSSFMGGDNDSGEDEDDESSLFKESYSDYKSNTAEFSINYGCILTTPLTEMINDTTPYLYPFSIEYNILIVGIWILLWENIGRMDRHNHLPSIELTYEDDNSRGITSNLIIYVDCHSSNRGLFAGLFMTVAATISIILFFIFTANEETKAHGLKVNGFSELIVHIIMIGVSILAYLTLRNLDIVKHKVSKVDDILLYICLPCIFLYAVFSMVPAITNGRPLFVAVSMVQVVQAVVQTVLICDGLRRCSNSPGLNTKKPGRELITFMVVANVALWLLETFEIKSEEGNFYKYDYYGKEAWTLLSHLTLPLALFYRFHSSVCLVDIWKAGYESDSEH